MGKKRKNTDLAEEPSQPPPKKRESTTPLPEGVHHYQDIEEVPWKIQKCDRYTRSIINRPYANLGDRYWHQGYSIFSRYDEGIWMTDDSWYGVTHESVAK